MMRRGTVKQKAWIVFFSAFVVALLLALLFLIAGNAAFLGAGDFFYYLGQSRTWKNFTTTLWTASLSTMFSMLVGIPVGYALSRRRFPLPKLLKTLIDLPVMVPPAAIGVFLLGVFTTEPLSSLQKVFGLKVDHALPGIIVAQFTVTVSFCIRLVMASFETVNPKFEHVARCLGASLPYAFFKVSLPLARNGIVAALIVVWARAAAEWESLMIFVGGIQGRTDVMPFAVYLDFVGGKLGWALTTSLFCVAIAVLSMAAVHCIGRTGHAV
jgi:ABC-type sulfate transport system permease component